MADVVVKLRIMPSGIHVDYAKLTADCERVIEAAGGHIHTTDVQDVAFGLKALIFVFLGDENKLNLDKIEAGLKKLEGVSSVDVLDVRRAVG